MDPRASTPAAPRPYFVSAPVDVALIGGASLGAWMLLAGLGEAGHLPLLVALLARFCNWPHFAATNYRLYHAWENVAQYPVTALVVPVFVGAAMLGALASPAGVAPLFVKLTLLWSAYHFSGQSLGIALLYARRAGCALEGVERRALSTFVFTTFLWATAHAETGAGTRHYLGVDHPRLGLPVWVGSGVEIALWASAAAFLALAVRRSVRRRRLLPPIVLLPVLTQFVWFVLGRDLETFQVFVPFFHSLQYLFVAWALQLKERAAATRRQPSRRWVVVETARWWGLNVVLGLALFALFPRLCAALGHDLLFAMAVTSSAVQLHHFVVDGVIWKLRSPRVGAPLLVSVEDLLRPTPRPVEAAA
jgi:hypothetical protein